MGFLVERGADADGLGAADGVVVGRVVAGRGQGAAGRSRGAGCAVVRSGVAVAGGAVLASGVRADGAGGVDGWPADDRDRDVRPVDGAQAALPVGVSVVGGGGVGLDPSATVLPDLAERAGAGRVDGPQAHAPHRARDGVGDDARADRDGDARETVSATGGADRLDRDRGGCEIPDRCGLGVGRRADARPRGSQAREADRLQGGAGAGSLAGDGAQAAGDFAHDPPPHRRGQERGAQAHGRDRRAVGALGQGSAPARRGRQAQGAGRGAKGKQRAAAKLEELAGRCEKVARQIKQRVAGEPIKDRIVSLFDPDARPIRKGKLGKPTEFGYVSQLAELTENTKTGARGLILPASTQLGNPSETTLLPGTVAELERLGISPKEVALDRGFMPGPTNTALADLAPKTVFIAGRQQPASKRTQRRLRRYRTGQERRISHLKRRYGLDRSRLQGDQGRQIWTEWAILAYNTDTLAVRTR